MSRLARPITRLAALVDDLDSGAETPAPTLEESAQRAQLISGLHAARDRIDAESDTWTRTIGASFAAQATDWDTIRAAAAWLDQLNTLTAGALPSWAL